MNWNNCFTGEGLKSGPVKKDQRSNFQKDYDRIIFSSAFRRLQNKTQVFPLPGTQFVHNRLTHSLEVASVGRSLAELAGIEIIDKYEETLSEGAVQFYNKDLPYVITAACLAHDIGNPAFGHSGEEAISNYFISNQNKDLEGQSLRSIFDEQEWMDLTQFEGNANALRVLTQSFLGKSPTGLGITLTSLAALLKYPCRSLDTEKSVQHRKKFGYFKSESEIFLRIADGINMERETEHIFKRHPFVYLVEAADDICYNIIDVEDAHKLSILSTRTVHSMFLEMIEKIGVAEVAVNQVSKTLKRIGDKNESIAYLRAKSISALVIGAINIFRDNMNEIIEGRLNSSLLKELEKATGALTDIKKISFEKIYRHPTVVEIEVAGFHVMSELIDIFLPPVLRRSRSKYDQSILSLIPNQFKKDVESDSNYLRTMNVLDHISGMTDEYATELYRKLTGIEISRGF